MLLVDGSYAAQPVAALTPKATLPPPQPADQSGVSTMQPDNVNATSGKSASATLYGPLVDGVGQSAASSPTWPDGPDAGLSGISGPLRHFLQEEAEQDYNSGTFNDGSYGQSTKELSVVTGLTATVKEKVQEGESLAPGDTYYINQYVGGKMSGLGASTAPQRLQNVMAGLGPQASVVWLQGMSQSDYASLGIAGSFDKLVSAGSLTPSDARQLVDGEVTNNTGTNPDFRVSTVANLVQHLGDDSNSASFKIAYAHEALNQAEQITTNLNAGTMHGESVDFARSERQELYGESSTILDATSNNDSAKRAAFEQLRADSQSLAKTDPTLAKQVAAYGLDVLGHASPAAIVAELRSMGGIDARGNIDPNSTLGTFMSSAVAGQASFGTNTLGPGFYAPPNGVASALSALAKSGDSKLTQGVLASVSQAFTANPGEAQAITAQDAMYHTGLQAAISQAMDSSFDAFVNRNGKANIAPDQALELTVLSGIESGPPFESGQGQAFATMLQSHAQSFAQFALGKDTPAEAAAMRQAFWKDPDARRLAADVSVGIMQSYLNGFTSEQATLVAQANGATSNDTFGQFLTKLQDGTTIAAAIPGPTQGYAAAAATIEGVASALHDFGLLGSDDPGAAATKANGILGQSETQSGAPAGAIAMNAYLKIVYTQLYNQSGANDPYLSAGAEKTQLGENASLSVNFFDNYRPTVG